MAKKRTRVSSVDPESDTETSQASKRARTDENVAGPSATQPDVIMNPPDDDGSDLEDNEEEIEQQLPNEEEEARFEQEHEERIRQKVSEMKSLGVSQTPVPYGPLAHPPLMRAERRGDGYH